MDTVDETILPKADYHSPFYTAVPTLSQPTEVLSRRFELWRQIIKSLVNYFKAASVATNQFSIINNNIVDTIAFPFFTSLQKTTVKGDVHEIKEPIPENTKKQSFFAPFGSGSIQDIQILLKKYHLNMAQQQIKIVHELQTVIIPRLEELQKDLHTKIREIKQLHGDFRNNLKEEIAISGQCLDEYLTAVRTLDGGDEHELHSKTDPFLLRVRLEMQLKQQLNQENYLEEAFINLQMTGLELEKIVFQEVQQSLNKYSELISQEIFVMYNDLINELHEGMISKPTWFEWDDFITRDDGRNFLKVTHDQDLPVPRAISTIKYPYNKHLISKSIRSGYFLKKSKILKNYSKAFFILTMNYLHEFKSANLAENIVPVNSIKLNDCILTESTDTKFQLHVKSPHSLKGHNYVFKIVPEEMKDAEFKKWIIDLKSLTSFNTFHERYAFVARKVAQSSTNSSGSGNTSTGGTPRFEVPNPMEAHDITRKLQEMQASYTSPTPGTGTPYTHANGSYSHLIPSPGSTSNTIPSSILNNTAMKSPKDKPITRPQENYIQRVSSPVYNYPAKPNLTRTGTDSSKLSINTLNVPTVEVHAPTPVQTQKPITLLDQPSELDYFSSAHGSAPPQHSHSSSDVHSDMFRSPTPAIGDLNAQRVEQRHIDLGQPLYGDEKSQSPTVEDPQLSKVMEAIGSIGQ